MVLACATYARFVVWRTKDGKIEITVIGLDRGQAYRITFQPGRYYGGDYRSRTELIAALERYGVDLADLIVSDD